MGVPVRARCLLRPGMNEPRDIRFAAVGDLHCTEASAGTLRGFFAQASEASDALLLCGDLTDRKSVV